MGLDISSLLQAIPAIMASFKGLNTKGQGDTTGQMQNVSNAMYNVQNPLYQHLYGQNQQAIQQQTGNTIAQMEGENRRLSGMGRTPLFSPERNGEVAFRTAVQSAGQAGQQAHQQTEGQLAQASNALHGVYGAQQANTENQFGNTSLGLGGFNSIADLLRQGGY